MKYPQGFPYRVVFTDTQGKEHGLGFYRTLDVAVAQMEYHMGRPDYAVDARSGTARGTLRGMGVYEVRPSRTEREWAAIEARLEEAHQNWPRQAGLLR